MKIGLDKDTQHCSGTYCQHLAKVLETHVPQRLFRLRSYRNALRSADRLITLSGAERAELARRLWIDARRIEVVMPLAASVPHSDPPKAKVEAERAKYSLPEDFVLMLGAVDPRHHHRAVLDALLAADLGFGVFLRACCCPTLGRHIQFIMKSARSIFPGIFL